MTLRNVPPAILAALGLGSGCTVMSVCLSATGELTESDSLGTDTGTDTETGTSACLSLPDTDTDTDSGTYTGPTGTADTGTADTGTGDTGTSTGTGGTTGIAPPSRPDVLRRVETKLPSDVVQRLRTR